MKKKIILVEDLEHWGKAGDLVEVSPGYARNFLIPTKKAILATSKNLKATEHQRKLIKEKQNKLKRETEKLAKILEGLTFSFERESGEEERIFGSVTSIDIEEALKKENILLDRKRILLPDPIKSLGEHCVDIKLHTEVIARIKVLVQKPQD